MKNICKKQGSTNPIRSVLFTTISLLVFAPKILEAIQKANFCYNRAFIFGKILQKSKGFTNDKQKNFKRGGADKRRVWTNKRGRQGAFGLKRGQGFDATSHDFKANAKPRAL